MGNGIDGVLKPEPHLLPWRPRIPPARLFSIGGKFHPAPHLLGEGKKRRGTELKMTPPLPLVRGHLHKNPRAIMWAEPVEEEEEDNIFAPSHLLAYSEVGKKKKNRKEKKNRKKPRRQARNSSSVIRERVAADARRVSGDKQPRVYTNVCLCRTP